MVKSSNIHVNEVRQGEKRENGADTLSADTILAEKFPKVMDIKPQVQKKKSLQILSRINKEKITPRHITVKRTQNFKMNFKNELKTTHRKELGLLGKMTDSWGRMNKYKRKEVFLTVECQLISIDSKKKITISSAIIEIIEQIKFIKGR